MVQQMERLQLAWDVGVPRGVSAQDDLERIASEVAPNEMPRAPKRRPI
jgi:hypothetical protein